MSAPKVVMLEHPRLMVVAYTITSISPTEATVHLLRVVPSRWDGALNLGQSIVPSRDEKISILKQIGALEFGLQEEAPAGGAR